MKISVIFTTYNAPKWLEKVIWGFAQQTDKNFELVIADDGSNDETRQLIESHQGKYTFDIQHIWHADDGFQKCQILNKAITAAQGEYIIMTDGDCIPRNDFVATHRRFAEPGHMLSGGYFKLPMTTSQSITYEDIKKGDCFDPNWLKSNGVTSSIKLMKLSAGPKRASLYNRLTPTKPTWNGHNASCYKTDMIKVNGFDERMRYGGQDREFGERLRNIGIKSKQIRYSAICIHLDHARGYANPEDWKRNNTIREHTRSSKTTRTAYGIVSDN